MVSFNAALIVLALRGMAGAATPTSVTLDPSMEVMAQASIYLCDDVWFRGQCRNELLNLNNCYNVAGGWNDRIRAIRNDSKSFYYCTWYLDAQCRGSSYSNQEDANLTDGDGAFGNSISSYSCTIR
ncbi:hypothetical protein LZ30DRAFT_597285 [Colletotrichum cereale]|nr:hypothetical protein LZ30DRAFT_597285 [Colletotrichum cereale]